jgi:hypothetical protein
MGFEQTTLETAQANATASVTAQVASMNAASKQNYMNVTWPNWLASVTTGRNNDMKNPPPPDPPMAYEVGYFDDPTTGGGDATPGPYANIKVQWAYPKLSDKPVCDRPGLPTVPPPQKPIPERDDIRNVPVGDFLPVGATVTDPVTGHVYQKQASPTPWGTAYFYLRIQPPIGS